MKCNSTLDINTEGLLKVKRRMIVHTSQSLVYNEQIEEVSFSFHITVEEDTFSDVEATNEEVDEAPQPWKMEYKLQLMNLKRSI